ncbi:MAG: HPr family phosphocarrier protein [Clostridia bacterium]|nr:HPr family phosphocarrier protein [Clostridia bacterium]
MKKTTIQLMSINDVKEFVNLAGAQMFDVDIVSGRYVIDAKSIMGIFSLDLSHPLEVHIHAEDAACEAFLAKLEKYRAE